MLLAPLQQPAASLPSEQNPPNFMQEPRTECYLHSRSQLVTAIPSPFTGSEEPELKLINTWYSMAITGLTWRGGHVAEVDPITLNKRVFIPQVGKKVSHCLSRTKYNVNLN